MNDFEQLLLQKKKKKKNLCYFEYDIDSFLKIIELETHSIDETKVNVAKRKMIEFCLSIFSSSRQSNNNNNDDDNIINIDDAVEILKERTKTIKLIRLETLNEFLKERYFMMNKYRIEKKMDAEDFCNFIELGIYVETPWWTFLFKHHFIIDEMIKTLKLMPKLIRDSKTETEDLMSLFDNLKSFSNNKNNNSLTFDSFDLIKNDKKEKEIDNFDLNFSKTPTNQKSTLKNELEKKKVTSPYFVSTFSANTKTPTTIEKQQQHQKKVQNKEQEKKKEIICVECEKNVCICDDVEQFTKILKEKSKKSMDKINQYVFVDEEVESIVEIKNKEKQENTNKTFQNDLQFDQNNVITNAAAALNSLSPLLMSSMSKTPSISTSSISIDETLNNAFVVHQKLKKKRKSTTGNSVPSIVVNNYINVVEKSANTSTSSTSNTTNTANNTFSKYENNNDNSSLKLDDEDDHELNKLFLTAKRRKKTIKDLTITKIKHKRTLTEADKKAVASSQKWKCKHCDNLLSVRYEVHHIDEHSISGNDHYTNLIALCPNCHSEETEQSRKDKKPAIWSGSKKIK